MDLKQHLLKIKQLHKGGMMALCFVDIGGIRKTTLTKTTFDDMKHMYDVLCFIESIENKDDGFSTICKILNQINFQSKSKEFERSSRNNKMNIDK